MVEGVDTPWDSTDATDAVLNATTYGQGETLPSVWPTNRLFFVTLTNTVYNNIGTLNTPDFRPISGMPIGSIIQFAGPTTAFPPGFLRCNGDPVSRTTYAALFLVIDIIYGAGDESLTFNVPDLETDNKFLSAASSNDDLNESDGANTVTLTTAQLPSHNHAFNDNTNADANNPFASANNPSGQTKIGSQTLASTTANAGSGDAHQNRPSNLKMYHLIKF